MAIVGAAALVLAFVIARATHDDRSVTPPPAASEAQTTSGPSMAHQAADAPTGAPIATSGMVPNAPAAAPGTAPSIDEVLAAKGSTEPGAVTTLIDGLASDDAVAVAEAANELVARGAISAIPALLDLDVAARPWAAPSAIYAMGALALKADAEDRDALVDHLLALLVQEKGRASGEALANLLQIYEALGQTHDARAVAPLERELADATVTTAPKVVIVQALVELGARESRPALERLRAEIAPGAHGPDFEAELKRDLIAAIDRALERLA